MAKRKRADRLSFYDHLEDLRRKILWVLAFFAVAFLVAYFGAAQRLVETLVRRIGLELYYLSVFEPFLTRIKVSVSLAVAASLPLLLVQVFRFVLPGLHKKEKIAFLGITGIFLALVVMLGYLLFSYSPLLLGYFLKTFASPAVAYHLSIATLISFYLMLLIGDALIILMPVLVFLLHKMGFITVKGIRSSRKIVIAGLNILAAVITQPDPFTLLIVAVPLYLIFEGSLLLLRAVDRIRFH